MAEQLPPEVEDFLGRCKTLATSSREGPWAATFTYVNDGPDIYIEPSVLEYIDNSRGVDEGADFGAEYRRQSVLDLPAIEG